ncbi:MAG: ABC transporter permease [Aestuariivita sp.]|nr:ABC transporter permease [Aestuariivita sp.]
MWRYLSVRLMQMLLALWAVSVVAFTLTHLSGNPVDALSPDDVSPEQTAALIKHWGLDKPLSEQYLTFLGNAIQGDFGQSIKFRGEPAMGVVLSRLPATLELGVCGLIFSIMAAIPLGVVSAWHRGSIIDTSANAIALFGQSIPPFWLGIILIWVFAVTLGWLPTSGRGSFAHIVMPAFSMAAFQIAALVRITRSAMLEVLDEEYIKLARLKGVSETRVVWVHAFRNATLAPLTYLGILAGSMLTGSVVIETVFSWPGTGLLAIEAITARDFPVVQAVVILFATIFLSINFFIDAIYALVDPRIRDGAAR